MTPAVLSSEEKALFEKDGFLVIPNALSPEFVATLVQAIDRCAGTRAGTLINDADILGRDPAFMSLIDLPTVFPKIWGILGWNIWVNHTHFNVNPPDPQADSFVYAWHRDGGAITFDLDALPGPRMLTKVGFYLTDLTVEGRGQTYIVPGSHREQENQHLAFDGRSAAQTPATPRYSESTTPQHIGAIPLKVGPGAAVVYDRRTVHSAYSPNHSGITRKAIFVQYAFRWLQAVDEMTVSEGQAGDDPVRRQLLGFTASTRQTARAAVGRSGRYYPGDADVPLRAHIRQVLGPAAGAAVARPVD